MKQEVWWVQPLRIFNLFICCNFPEAIACLALKYQIIQFRAHLMDFKWLYNKMLIEMNQKLWWVQSLRKYGLLYFVNHENEIYAPVALQKP